MDLLQDFENSVFLIFLPEIRSLIRARMPETGSQKRRKEGKMKYRPLCRIRDIFRCFGLFDFYRESPGQSVSPEEEWSKLTKEQREILRQRYQEIQKASAGATTGDAEEAGSIAEDGAPGQGVDPAEL